MSHSLARQQNETRGRQRRMAEARTAVLKQPWHESTTQAGKGKDTGTAETHQLTEKGC